MKQLFAFSECSLVILSFCIAFVRYRTVWLILTYMLTSFILDFYPLNSVRCFVVNSASCSLIGFHFLYYAYLIGWSQSRYVSLMLICRNLVQANYWFLTKFDEIGKIRDSCQNFWWNFLLFDERKMAFFAAKSSGYLEKALSHKFYHVTF